MNAAPQYHELSPWARLAMFLEALPDPEPLEIGQPAPAAPPPHRPTRRTARRTNATVTSVARATSRLK